MKDMTLSAIESITSDKIFFAVESGSRAWGIASEDSDYDIRYVYYKPPKSYLQLFPPRSDAQENFIEDDSVVLDLVGWDIYKFLRLIATSNPSALEWLRSPIIYIDHPLRRQLVEITNQFSRFSLFMHYKSLAWENYKRYIEDNPQASAKKLLYVLRGLFAAIYIIELDDFPPLRLKQVLDRLAEESLLDMELQVPEVEQMIAFKQSGSEMSTYRIDPSLLFWVKETFDHLDQMEQTIKERDHQNVSKTSLEQILQQLLDL